jgi:hypothetical protein
MLISIRKILEFIKYMSSPSQVTKPAEINFLSVVHVMVVSPGPQVFSQKILYLL